MILINTQKIKLNVPVVRLIEALDDIKEMDAYYEILVGDKQVDHNECIKMNIDSLAVTLDKYNTHTIARLFLYPNNFNGDIYISEKHIPLLEKYMNDMTEYIYIEYNGNIYYGDRIGAMQFLNSIKQKVEEVSV